MCHSTQQINWKRQMKRNRFSEEQTIRILKEGEALEMLKKHAVKTM